MNVLYAGLIVWLVTLILVESFAFAGLREYVEVLQDRAIDRAYDDPSDRNLLLLRAAEKLTYLVNCHLCTGVWVGLVVALIIPGPLPMVLNALLYKAVGHLVLEVAALLRRTGA